MKKIVCLLLLIISSAVTGYFTAQILFGCRLTETLYFKTLFEPPPVYIELFFIIAPCALLMFLQKRFGLEQLTKAMVPALLLIPFFFFAYNFWTICAVIAIGSLCIFRLLLVLPAPKTIFSSDSKKYSLILLSIFTTIAIIQWIYLYDQSWKRQFMFFYDWGMFVEPALNTLRGDFMTEYWYNPGNSFLAHHFMPGFFIWFIPLMWLFPFPQTIMVVGALILGVSALLIFYFARQRKLPPVFAGLCGLLYLLYPTITNYNLSLFYGFHVIYLFIPVFIIFCILYEREKWVAAFLVFLFSLSIKETVGAFWVGWGIFQFLSGHRKRGILYALISGCYLILCIKFIIPAFSPENHYIYQSHFDYLGKTLLEIALSPILSPGAFFGALLAPKKLLLLSFLTLPFVPAIFTRPFWAGCCFVTMTFVFLRAGGTLINLHNQYTIEISILFCLAFIAAVSDAYRNGANRGCRLLSTGIPEVDKPHLAWALLGSGLVASLGAHLFLAEAFYSKNSSNINTIMRRPDRTAIRKKVTELVTPGTILGTDERSGALMLASPFKIANIKYYPNCDYYFYDLSEFYGGISYDFHQKLLENPEFGLVWKSSASGADYYLFQRDAASKYPNPLRRRSEYQWHTIGQPLELQENNHLFSVHVRPIKVSVRLGLTVTISVKAKIDSFYRINFYASNGQNSHYYRFLFADGIVSPKDINPGDTWQVELPLPPNWTTLHSCGCKITND